MKIELTLEETQAIENFNLKQEIIDKDFLILNQKAQLLKEESRKFFSKIGEKYGVDLLNTKAYINGNILEVDGNN